MRIDLAICKHFTCLPTDDRFKNLSFYQKILLYNTIVDDKKDTVSLIKECFSAIQPWLDKDMYFKLKETNENVRVNASPGENIDAGDSIEVE